MRGVGLDLLDSSIKLIQEFEPMALQSDPRGYCVCSSFGKDSMALIEVYRRAGVKFFIKWNITGIDPPELVYFGREQVQRYKDMGIVTEPQMYEKHIWKMIVDHKVPPSRIFRYCCDELKEKRLPKDQHCLYSFGVRKAESSSRGGRNELEVLHKDKDKRLSLPLEQPQTSLYLFSDNDNRRQFENCTTKGVRAINPLVYWSDNFLWDFTMSEKIPYCRLYDEGFTRLGCIGCPMSRGGRKTEFARYPKFYDQYMRTFDKMLIRRKIDRVDERRVFEGLKPMGWNCAQDVMDWYLEERQDENQLFIDGWDV